MIRVEYSITQKKKQKREFRKIVQDWEKWGNGNKENLNWNLKRAADNLFEWKI